METKTQKPEIGSSIRAVESNGTQAASVISDRDLKILSLEYAGECDGIYYFRRVADPTGPLLRGSVDDLNERMDVQARHPMIDAWTAAAALQARQMARQPTPFGTLATDEVAS